MSKFGEGIIRPVVFYGEIQHETLIAAVFCYSIFTIALDAVFPGLTSRRAGVVIVVERGAPALVDGVASTVVEVAVNGADVPEVRLKVLDLGKYLSAAGLPEVAQRDGKGYGAGGHFQALEALGSIRPAHVDCPVEFADDPLAFAQLMIDVVMGLCGVEVKGLIAGALIGSASDSQVEVGLG